MDKKLNNLLSIEEYSCDKFCKKSKVTKRTEIGKDILAESNIEYSKDWVKNVDEKPKQKQIIVSNNYNNLISLDDFGSKELPKNVHKQTKRTEVGKDILLEKSKKSKDEKECKDKKECKDDKEFKDDKKRVGLTPGQKKLPKALQDSILARQKSKK